MSNAVRRMYVEKNDGFNIEALDIYAELTDVLHVEGLRGVRILNRYDVQGLSFDDYQKAVAHVFSEPAVDSVYFDSFTLSDDETAFAFEPLPGQYDQLADSAAQCVQALIGGYPPVVRTAKTVSLIGDIGAAEVERVKRYMINEIECRETAFDIPDTLEQAYPRPSDIGTIAGFVNMDGASLRVLRENMQLAMSDGDLELCAAYFRDGERRDPTVTELRIIDTYWSDHCRHTTFLTEIPDISFDGEAPAGTEDPAGAKTPIGASFIRDAFDRYLEIRGELYGHDCGTGDSGKPERPVTLMDIATIAAKKLRREGKLGDLDISDEVNACSISVDVETGGETQEWLVMFKNETHNHPTEIEPFGGASTCLGGAIRDPLSGRAYVYQAMRVTGCADPRTDVADTLTGKLPQRKITVSAAKGYSSYGNRIGIPTGHLREIYHPGYVAKRMELGAIVGAAPKNTVRREKPGPGDVVILLGGRTGRDGIGGATGSSKTQDESSLTACGAEVQKGNPSVERMILRLFRKPEVTGLIKKCNDFGAGGVAVAVVELTSGLSIDLDRVPVKYDGLDGTEIALSESQERMAVVVAGCDAAKFIALAEEENLEATIIADVNSSERIVMNWRGGAICDISRGFLDSNGAVRRTRANVVSPESAALEKFAVISNPVNNAGPGSGGGRDLGNGDGLESIKAKWLENLSGLNVCSQEGLIGKFDSTAGANTVLMPLGGVYQRTPAEGMAAKIPVPNGDTTAATLMTYGFDPYLSSISPFHGALYAVVESLAKLAALGGNIERARLSFQEFYEKPGTDPDKWGKPFAALLGALRAQLGFGLAAIGGKDSMSGTFGDYCVPPTLVSFALAPSDTREIISPEFKLPGNRVVLLAVKPDPDYPGARLPDIASLKQAYMELYGAAREGKILSAYPVREGGVAAAISMMCFGNGVGFECGVPYADFFAPAYGSIVVELSENAGDCGPRPLLGGSFIEIGRTVAEPAIFVGGIKITLDEAVAVWEKPLEGVFPVAGAGAARCRAYTEAGGRVSPENRRVRINPARSAKPRALVIVTPGASGEYESARSFERAGAKTEILVVKNNTPAGISESLAAVAGAIRGSDIIALPGGYCGGDEPDGSGKFAAAFLRRAETADALAEFLGRKGGLILGVGGGFQALVKLGLLPYGKITDPSPASPALTLNAAGGFVSRAVNIIVCKNNSPWLTFAREGETYTLPIAHGGGRFFADDETIAAMEANLQIATRYADPAGEPAEGAPYNPDGSVCAVEGITSPDGRVYGKMGRPERVSEGALKNIYGNACFDIYGSGVDYFN